MSIFASSRFGVLVALAALASVGSGCSAQLGDGIEGDNGEPPRSLVGVAGKPVVEAPRGAYIADELVVKLHPDAAPSRAEELASSLDAELVWRGPRTGALVLRFADDAAAKAAAPALDADGDVVWHGRSYVASGTGISTSPGPVRNLQWNLQALRLDADRPWGDARGIRVAVLDTGAAYEDHADAGGVYALAPDLAGVVFAPGYDFVNDDDHPNDDVGHGTHVTGVITTSDGVVPMAPEAEVMPVKVLDSTNRGTELALAEGILYAVDNGAQVVNMSLSFPPTYFPSPVLHQAIDEAVSAGVVLVAASGNHGAGIVAYPAAFREVIAVGASQLGGDFRVTRNDTWARAFRGLEAADYSNRGYSLDIVAPGGRLDVDHDGNGDPEAIVAQSFDGDPTDFDYYLYAGTSQAAAHVSGLAAVMLAENPDLTGENIRALLGATAKRDSWREVLDPAIGQGYPRANLSLWRAGSPFATRDRLETFAGVAVVIREDSDGNRFAEATVEVTDERGWPLPLTRVYGTFSGNALGSVEGRTNWRGIATFRSEPLRDDAVVAGFQVDAVAGFGTLDRPRGSLRIDSCSLELLGDFAVATGAGISTSPGQQPGPITTRYADLSSDAVPTVNLMSYAFSGAVAPMAVAVDEAWYRTEFPGSDEITVEIEGTGISTSPVIIRPPWSFHPAVLAAWQPDNPDGPCADLVLRTYSSGPVDTQFSPLIPDPLNCRGAACHRMDDLLLAMWQAFYWGINTSPLWEPSMGIGVSLFDHLEQLSQGYATFGAGNQAFPIGSLGGVLDAAGIGLTPTGGI